MVNCPKMVRFRALFAGTIGLTGLYGHIGLFPMGAHQEKQKRADPMFWSRIYLSVQTKPTGTNTNTKPTSCAPSSKSAYLPPSLSSSLVRPSKPSHRSLDGSAPTCPANRLEAITGTDTMKQVNTEQNIRLDPRVSSFHFLDGVYHIVLSFGWHVVYPWPDSDKEHSLRGTTIADLCSTLNRYVQTCPCDRCKSGNA